MVKARSMGAMFRSASRPIGVQRPGLPDTEPGKDTDGEFAMVPRKTLTLVEKLMVRAGAMAAPVQAPKRGRGRPRKAVQQ